ncbi:MAG: diguanylate cyclase [Candidatus Atribacteria bacterium]|nr:diguanylate cyclase [Candidatus Atribacteria bacterium]MCD6349373.1 diguanylate cyclase [Candidatus Atribacteria bacterium]
MEKPVSLDYQLIIEKLPDGFAYHQIVLDEEGKPVDFIFLEVNPAFEKLTGLRREELLGKRATEVLPGIEKSASGFIATCGRVALSRETVRFQAFLEPLSRWYDITLSSEREGFFAAVFRDITEIKNVQVLQQKILDGIPYPVCLISQERRVLAANKAAEEFLGAKVGEPCWLFFSGPGLLSEREKEEFTKTGVWPSSIRCSFCGLDEALECGKAVVKEIEISGKFYLAGWIPAGPNECLHYAFDITEYKEKERELRREWDRFREYLRVVDVIFVVLNPQGEVVFANQKASELLGYPPEEIVGKSWFEFFIPERWRDRVREVFRQIMSGKIEKYRHFENPIQDRYGRERLIAWHSTFLQNEEGLVEEIISAGIDITETRKMEERLRYLSFHDQLTGLHNRAFLEEEMRRLDVERQLPLSVIMVDLNGLKLVNDTYGHEFGDLLLKSAARVLRASCRKEDIVVRYGGDEFVVLLPQTTHKTAREICLRIHKAAEKVRVQNVPLSLALGVATKAQKSENLAEVLRRAEDEMYRQKLAESKSTHSSIVNALLKALSTKSHETEQHVLHMQKAGIALGRELGLTPSELNRLKLAILLHDIGKITIPEEILKKPAPLAPEEWEVVKKHPEMGYRIARSTEEFAHVAEEVWSHHERWDGKGYPRGLRGEEIPFLARIVAIVDAYEAMRHGRAYKKPLSREKILAELRRKAGTQFDPRITEVFISLLEQGALD